jgi:Flp pilus assembly protein TadD
MVSQADIIQAQLQQAMTLQKARRHAEAEAIYKQILTLKPDFTEVQIQCALTQLGQGKQDDAEALLRATIRNRPDEPAAHYYLADLQCMRGQMETAVASYRRALSLQPGRAATHNNLGNALLLLKRLDEAEEAYNKALELNPNLPQTYNNLGLIWLHQGRLEQARAAFGKALALAPRYAEARNNLGLALQKLGKAPQAEAAFRAATLLAPNFVNAFVNLSTCLHDMGSALEAEKAARGALEHGPANAEAHAALGNSLRAQGKLDEAETGYREALQRMPGFTDGHRLLAMLVAERGRLDEAFAIFREHARLVYGTGPKQDAIQATHKLEHDREQQIWMGSNAVPFSISAGDRLNGSAVNVFTRVTEIAETWRTTQPQLVVVDDFLTTAALEKLRNFCLDSTIWQKVYDGGYLGAFPEHGFAPPLLAQIAEEMRQVYPSIIGDHPLLHFWAFKYDSKLQGIKKHADFAAVNVNFWITPDEANLDPEHGGLIVWDAAAPLDWDFARYNAANEDIEDFLRSRNSRSTKIPYRNNRAVIFDSDLFHETDVIRFKEGYENRRINITLLFGRRDPQSRRN